LAEPLAVALVKADERTAFLAFALRATGFFAGALRGAFLTAARFFAGAFFATAFLALVFFVVDAARFAAGFFLAVAIR
jgi:hypothetical protein